MNKFNFIKLLIKLFKLYIKIAYIFYLKKNNRNSFHYKMYIFYLFLIIFIKIDYSVMGLKNNFKYKFLLFNNLNIISLLVLVIVKWKKFMIKFAS